jgi:hypothetical protein
MPVEVEAELQKINLRLEKLEELIRLLHDVTIEMITLKKDTNLLEDVVEPKKKIINEFDNTSKTFEEIDKQYYLEFNLKNLSLLEEKLSVNSANNKVNVFKYLYIHFDDQKKYIINKLNCQEFIDNLQNDKKKYKNVCEMLKTEAIEIHKEYKDKDDFKKLLIHLKKEYDSIISTEI